MCRPKPFFNTVVWIRNHLFIHFSIDRHSSYFYIFCLWKHVVSCYLNFYFPDDNWAWMKFNYLLVLQPTVRKTFFANNPACNGPNVSWNNTILTACDDVWFFSFLSLFFSLLPPSFFLLNIVHYPLNWLKDLQKDHYPRWKKSQCMERPEIHFPFSHPSPISSLTYSVNWGSYWAMDLRFFREIV